MLGIKKRLFFWARKNRLQLLFLKHLLKLTNTLEIELNLLLLHEGISLMMETSLKDFPKYFIIIIPRTTTIRAFGIFIFIFLKITIIATEKNPMIVV